jgi:hypothetical protein
MSEIGQKLRKTPKVGKKSQKQSQEGRLSHFLMFIGPTSTKRGQKAPFYIILHNFFSLPGRKTGTPHPFT